MGALASFRAVIFERMGGRFVSTSAGVDLDILDGVANRAIAQLDVMVSTDEQVEQ